MEDNLIPKSFFVEQKTDRILFIIILILNISLFFNFIFYFNVKNRKKNLETKALKLQNITENNEFEKHFEEKKQKLNLEINELEEKSNLTTPDYNTFFKKINSLKSNRMKFEKIKLEKSDLEINLFLKDQRDLKKLRENILDSGFELEYEKINYKDLIEVELKGSIYNF